jgi:hypothetical protein
METNTGAKAWFNIQTGITGSLTGSNATITAVSGGWYRCALYFTSSVASGPQNIQYNLADANGNLSYAGVAGTGSYLWGAQFENGNVLGPYRATTATGFTTGSMLDQMKYNLKNSADTDAAFRTVFTGVWNPGYSGNRPDGLTAVGDTKLNASASLANGNSHITLYTRTNTARTTGGSYNESDFGAYNGSDFIAFWTKRAGEAGFILSNPTSNDGQQYGGLGGSGYYLLTDNSTPSLPKFYINKNQITGGSFFSQGSTLPNSTVRFGQIQGNYSDKEATFATVGDGLTDYEAKALYWIVQKYQTTLGRQVY